MRNNDGRDRSLLTRRIEKDASFDHSERPPFPKNMMVELTNVCNHRCRFCAYVKSTRPKKNADPVQMEGIIKQAFTLGTRELGLHSGTEPFVSKDVERYISFSKHLGYQYVYLSTNGSLATPDRIKNALDLGLDSIKFSINAGNRETYKAVHGRDDFDKVIRHVRFTAEHREAFVKKPYLAVTFVEFPGNAGQMTELKGLLEECVDEMILLPAVNQSGEMPELDGPVGKVIEGTKKIKYPFQKAPCPLPFNRVHISCEGYIRACCNDYQNYLAIEDLAGMSLEDAFYSERFRSCRRRHLEDKVHGTLCSGCLYKAAASSIRPLRKTLSAPAPAGFFGDPS